MSSSSADYKTSLLSLLISSNVLSFGTYTLKSGRTSPYFMTTTMLHTAPLLHATASAFANILSNAPFAEKDAEGNVQPTFDILFGPAYKGIPLATATMNELGVRNSAASAWASVSYSFNRKEAKAHGEGGNIVGAPLKGKRCVIIDDVITAGTALREAVDIIEKEGGIVAGVLVLMDRQERVKEEDPEKKSAIQTAEEALGGNVPIVPLLRFQDIIEKLGNEIGGENIRKMKEYKERYGAAQ
ncbi:orotate phosphoribosyltransferase [Ascosphaera aggregata]|nr:orotate phosphoribosyltransferase [Ascosphaera aggregata]